jgi:hypothetical protein
MAASNALAVVTNFLSNGYLRLYSGTQPSTPETALSGNTLLATFQFATPAFGSASLSSGYEQQTASFAASSVAPAANGTVTFARASINALSWATSTSYSYGQIVTSNSNLYFCTKAGTSSSSSGSAPSGTTIPYTSDGTVVWQYIAASTATVVADFTVNTSGADIIIGNNVLSTTINVTITSFILQIPAV